MASNFGVIVADGYGAYYVTITRIQHGMEITQKSESARNRRTVYVLHRVEPDFSIEVVMPSFEKHETFVKWMAGYAQKVSDGSAKPMRVVYPARNFDKTGVPVSISFGDRAAQVLYPTKLQFTTSKDLVNDRSAAVVGALGTGWSQAFGSSVDADTNLMVPFGFQLTAFDPGSYELPQMPPDFGSFLR